MSYEMKDFSTFDRLREELSRKYGINLKFSTTNYLKLLDNLLNYIVQLENEYQNTSMIRYLLTNFPNLNLAINGLIVPIISLSF